MVETNKRLTKSRKLLESRRGEINIVVSATAAAVNNANFDSLATVADVGRLSASGAMVGIGI